MGKEEKGGEFLFFGLFGWLVWVLFVFLCLLACFGFCFVLFYFGGHCRGEGSIWGNPEVSGIDVHDVELSPKKSIKKIHFKKLFSCPKPLS